MKRNGFIVVLLSFLTTMGLFSCSQKTASAPSDELTFDSIVKDTAVVLTHSTDTGRCTLHMSVLCAKGKNAHMVNDTLLRSDIFWKIFCDTSLQGMTMPQALDTYAKGFVEHYKDEITPLMNDGFGGVAATYNYNVTTTVQPGRDSTVTYVASIYAFTGGAHGSAETIVLNFDTRTGRCLTLGDVLRHGYEVTTNRLIEQQLLRVFEAKTVSELHTMTFFPDQKVFTPNNFILGKDSITFIYLQDEVAPHAAGEIRVAIPYKDLDGVLRQ